MPGWSAARKAVAVTGAASGIGRALCSAFTRAGARSVLCLDRDVAGAQRTAELCKQTAQACSVDAAHCDASNAKSLRSALRAAGPIDLFAANAGVATVGDCGASDEAWQDTWNLNVMQIAWAADELCPAMIERGGGGILITASAAGLLTQLGSAPYATTKHAAVGLAEWLAITYGERGLSVTCVCPQGVRTPMITDAPTEGLSAVLAKAAGVDGLVEADEVAAEALQSLAEGRFLCMPGGSKGPQKHVERKAADRERWVRSMSKFNERLRAAET